MKSLPVSKNKESHANVIKRWREDGKDNYLYHFYDLTPDSVIFDVGAYKGDWAQKMFELYGCRVFCFEPVADSFLVLKKRFADIERVRIFNYAVGNSVRRGDIYLSGDGSSISVDPGACKTAKVAVKPLSLILQELKLDKVDLIKINIENGEYELFEDVMGNNIQSKFVSFQVQFHRDVPSYIDKRKGIRDILSKTHKEDYNYEFVWESWTLLESE
jgi:FkbM family methyltransferase